MDVEQLARALRRIEERHAPPGGMTPEAYRQQLAEWRAREPDRDDACTLGDATQSWLLMRLCAKYGIPTFRRPRQKPTSFWLRAPPTFVTKVVWPQLREMAGVFESARRAMAEEISRAWLGAEADVPLLVGEEPKP